jgi:flagellar assembly protein FliH
LHTTLVIPLPYRVRSVEAVPAPNAPSQNTGTPGPVPSAVHSMGEAMKEAEARLQEERVGLGEARQAVEAAAEAIRNLRAEVIRTAEAQLVDLALAIAKKVLAQEIEGGRYKIEPLVQEALRLAPARRDVLVHLNPQDLAQYQQAPTTGSNATGTGGPTGNVKLVADPAVRRAQCLVETAEGVISSQTADRLEAAAAAIKE